MGCFSSLDFAADKLENSTVVGVPIGGFYFSNEKVSARPQASAHKSAPVPRSPLTLNSYTHQFMQVYQGTADYPQSSYIPWTFGKRGRVKY